MTRRFILPRQFGIDLGPQPGRQTAERGLRQDVVRLLHQAARVGQVAQGDIGGRLGQVRLGDLHPHAGRLVHGGGVEGSRPRLEPRRRLGPDHQVTARRGLQVAVRLRGPGGRLQIGEGGAGGVGQGDRLLEAPLVAQVQGAIAEGQALEGLVVSGQLVSVVEQQSSPVVVAGVRGVERPVQIGFGPQLIAGVAILGQGAKVGFGVGEPPGNIAVIAALPQIFRGGGRVGRGRQPLARPRRGGRGGYGQGLGGLGRGGQAGDHAQARLQNVGDLDIAFGRHRPAVGRAAIGGIADLGGEGLATPQRRVVDAGHARRAGLGALGMAGKRSGPQAVRRDLFVAAIAVGIEGSQRHIPAPTGHGPGAGAAQLGAGVVVVAHGLADRPALPALAQGKLIRRGRRGQGGGGEGQGEEASDGQARPSRVAGAYGH